MKRYYVDLTQGQLHYRKAGQGPNLIMVHMSGSSSEEFEKSGNILAKNFTVYAIDLFGFGGSDVPEHYLSVSQHSESIIEFADKLGLERFYLVGNLVGANIVLRTAAMAPNRTMGLLSLHPCYDPGMTNYPAYRMADGFSAVETKADGSHLIEMWKRSDKYGESPAANDERALCLHIAGKNGEVMHWALFEDEEFFNDVSRLRGHVLFIDYGIIGPAFSQTNDGKRTVELLSKELECGYRFIADASPYYDRVKPDIFASIVRDFFMSAEDKNIYHI